MLSQIVHEEPTESLDDVRLGFYASVGIENGKPFAPDERSKKLLAEAAAFGDASARAITYRNRQQGAYYYEDSSWKRLFIGGYKFEVEPGVLNLDGYDQFYFFATGVTPAKRLFSTGSALLGPPGASAFALLSGANRTLA